MRYTHGAMLLRFHKQALATAILLGAGLGQNALAQSSGTDAIEEDLAEVVVSATRVRSIGLVGDQTAPKSRVSLTGEYLDTQMSGQTRVPEPEPDSGRQLHQHRSLRHLGRQPAHPRIRRLARLGDVRRHSAQRLRQLRVVHEPDARPELIDRVDVNLGTTDVDSPTASATGGTVAYRTRRPTEEFGGQAVVVVRRAQLPPRVRASRHG